MDFRDEEARRVVAGRRVMVTGAGGSIGGELCRRLLPLGPAELILLGRGENSLFEIETELEPRRGGAALRTVIADVRDRDRLRVLARQLRMDHPLLDQAGGALSVGANGVELAGQCFPGANAHLAVPAQGDGAALLARRDVLNAVEQHLALEGGPELGGARRHEEERHEPRAVRAPAQALQAQGVDHPPGVTLGGVTWDKVKRHPTVEDNVVIGSGSKVLGPFVVGKGAKIGSNSVVVKEVPQNATVVGIPGRVVMQEEKKVVEDEQRPDLEHGKLPDPEAKAISCLFDQIRILEKKVEDLTTRLEESGAKPAVKKTVKRVSSTKSPAAKTGTRTTGSRKKQNNEA